MSVQLDHFDDLGDGRVRAYARTPSGAWASVVMGRDKLGGADMYAMLDRAATEVDAKTAALAARRGRSDQDAT